jgi:DNA repair protein RecO (recombination protein O)
MSLYRDQGIVIRTWKLGESDRIIVIITEDNGKVRAVAKGVRKTRSKFGGRLEPTSHVALQLFRGKGDLGIVTQAETIDRFQNIRSDPDLFSDASSMLEVVDHVAPDESPDPNRYKMLLGALRTLDEKNPPLLVPAFFLKLLDHEGLAPELGFCVKCLDRENLVSISISEGGVFCNKCKRGKSISDSSIAVMRAILGGALNQALEVEDGKTISEIDRIASEAVEFHLERKIRSRRVMDT